jgi:hypothetical protein
MDMFLITLLLIVIASLLAAILNVLSSILNVLREPARLAERQKRADERKEEERKRKAEWLALSEEEREKHLEETTEMREAHHDRMRGVMATGLAIAATPPPAPAPAAPPVSLRCRPVGHGELDCD